MSGIQWDSGQMDHSLSSLSSFTWTCNIQHMASCWHTLFNQIQPNFNPHTHMILTCKWPNIHLLRSIKMCFMSDIITQKPTCETESVYFCSHLTHYSECLKRNQLLFDSCRRLFSLMSLIPIFIQRFTVGKGLEILCFYHCNLLSMDNFSIILTEITTSVHNFSYSAALRGCRPMW